MNDVIYWFGVALLVLTYWSLSQPSTREKGERLSPSAVLICVIFLAVHAYNYSRLF